MRFKGRLRAWRSGAILWPALVLAGGVVTSVLYRTQMVLHADLLPVAFEHLDHSGEKCVGCHHNYADDTGYDSCYSCHKHDRSVALEIEPMFHDLCRDCHLEKARLGLASGPFRVCIECHNTSGRMPQALEDR